MATGGGPLPRSYGLEEIPQVLLPTGDTVGPLARLVDLIERPPAYPALARCSKPHGRAGRGREPAVPEADGLLAQRAADSRPIVLSGSVASVHISVRTMFIKTARGFA